MRFTDRTPEEKSLQIDISKLNVFYADDEGAAYISSVRSDMRYSVRRVVSHLAATHGCDIQEMRTDLFRDGCNFFLAASERNGVPPMRFFFKLPPKGINPKRELSLKLAGLSYHTLGAIRMSWMDKRYRKKRNEQRRRDDLRRLDDLETLVNSLLGDNGVLVFPANLSAAPFHNAVSVGDFDDFGQDSECFMMRRTDSNLVPSADSNPS